MKQSLQASVDGLPLNSSGTALTRLPELITATGCHRRAAGTLQKRPRSGSPLRCAKDRRLVYFFYGSRVKQHRADRAGQEVRHRNSIERPVYFQNKTPRGRISTINVIKFLNAAQKIIFYVWLTKQTSLILGTKNDFIALFSIMSQQVVCMFPGCNSQFRIRRFLVVNMCFTWMRLLWRPVVSLVLLDKGQK